MQPKRPLACLRSSLPLPCPLILPGCSSDSDCAQGKYCSSKQVCISYSRDHCYYHSCGLGDGGSCVRIRFNLVSFEGVVTRQFIGLSGCCFRMRCRHIVVRLKSAKCTLQHLDPNCRPPPYPLHTTSHTKRSRRLRPALRLERVWRRTSLWKEQLRKISQPRQRYRLQFWVGLL